MLSGGRAVRHRPCSRARGGGILCLAEFPPTLRRGKDGAIPEGNKLRPIVRELVHGARRIRGRSELRAGRIASLTPLSAHFGLDRGTPIDRYYIEKFLLDQSGDIRGVALEIVDSTYSKRFGGDQVTTQHVADINDDNPSATIVGDISDPKILPDQAFDCIVLTQTLHLIYDLKGVVRQLRRALKPGGVLLVTAPGITPARPAKDYRWYWSLTPDSLQRLLAEAFDPANVQIHSYGNLFAATAFLHGAALEEIDTGRLDPVDPAFPVIVAGRAVA